MQLTFQNYSYCKLLRDPQPISDAFNLNEQLAHHGVALYPAAAEKYSRLITIHVLKADIGSLPLAAWIRTW